MIDAKALCTCQDKACPLNPVNHDNGCTPCIAKNLELGEIPSCLFLKAGLPRRSEGYTFEEFAKALLK